jgi:hypothetical protein
MITLNNREKINKSKIELEEVLVLVKVKHLEEVLKVKNQDLV